MIRQIESILIRSKCISPVYHRIRYEKKRRGKSTVDLRATHLHRGSRRYVRRIRKRIHSPLQLANSESSSILLEHSISSLLSRQHLSSRPAEFHPNQLSTLFLAPLSKTIWKFARKSPGLELNPKFKGIPQDFASLIDLTAKVIQVKSKMILILQIHCKIKCLNFRHFCYWDTKNVSN